MKQTIHSQPFYKKHLEMRNCIPYSIKDEYNEFFNLCVESWNIMSSLKTIKNDYERMLVSPKFISSHTADELSKLEHKHMKILLLYIKATFRYSRRVKIFDTTIKMAI